MQASLPKLDRIQHLGDTLLEDVAAWNNTHPLRVEFVIDDDGHGWYWSVIGFDPEPELHAWGVRFGEIAHHFRSLLNHTLTRIARAEGLPRDRQLQFPITTSAAAWRRERKRLRNIPDRVVRAVYAHQPFVMARGTNSAPEMNVLAVLGWADNEEKHEVDLVPVMKAAEFTIDNSVEFRRPGASFSQNAADVVYDGSMTPGSRLAHARYTEDIVTGPGTVDFTMRMDVAILDSEANAVGLQPQMNEFMDTTKHILHTVLMAWDDLSVDMDDFAGSSDFKRGSSFGKAAVDEVTGDGTWSRDFAHTPRFQEIRAAQMIDDAVHFGELRGLLSNPEDPLSATD